MEPASVAVADFTSQKSALSTADREKLASLEKKLPQRALGGSVTGSQGEEYRFLDG